MESKGNIVERFTEKFRGRTVIYSNRPPVAGNSGGAQEVIAAASPTWWIGPQKIANKFWEIMTRQERAERTLHGDQNAEEKPAYDVQTFPVPEVLESEQYKTISNEILWPVAHSMQPNTTKTLEEIEAAYWGGYLRHNELANNALRDMVDEYDLTNDDRVWVHDYQCDNVPGTLYTRHIPWPSVDFLESVTFNTEANEEVAILNTEFFRDLMELSSSRILSTFQRPIDQANFIMTAAYVAGKSEKFAGQFSIEYKDEIFSNFIEDVRDPAKREAIQRALVDKIKLGSDRRTTHITLFGAKTTLMNVPVGQVTEKTHAEALENAHNLDVTAFNYDKQRAHFSVFHADIGDGVTANLTSRDEADFDKHNPPKVKDFFEPLEGRKIVLSGHRNDYTKGTLTKLEAAEELFTRNPQRQDDTTFLFMLQPTREDVAGYKEYATKVYKKALELRKKYGPQSVVIIPEGIKHEDLIGLMYQSEIRGFLALGHKDGHDLTAREILDANEYADDTHRPIGNIVSSGIGAADVTGEGDKGSFVIKDPTDASEVADAIEYTLDDRNRDILAERFNWQKNRSRQYDAANFCREVDGAYIEASNYHFDSPEVREKFLHPVGDYYIDRNGEVVTPPAGVPDYVETTLEGKLILKDTELMRHQHKAVGKRALRK